LAATVTDVVPIELYAVTDSEILRNDFQAAGPGTYKKKVILTTSGAYGNKVQIDYDPKPTA
jgi:hypothetical protein